MIISHEVLDISNIQMLHQVPLTRSIIKHQISQIIFHQDQMIRFTRMYAEFCISDLKFDCKTKTAFKIEVQ